MSSNSSMWILLAAGAAVLIALLLLGPVERTSTESVSVAQPIATSISAERASAPRGAPVAHAGPDQTVGERETVQLRGEGYSPGGGAVSYLWTAEGGLGYFENAHGAAATYTAPSACSCEECVVLTLTVTSASGISASDSMVLYVRDPVNCPVETHDVSGCFTTEIDRCQYVGDRATCPAQSSEACASPCITDVPAYNGCTEQPVPCPCSTDGCESMWTSSWPFDPKPEHPRDRAKPRIHRHYQSVIDEGSAVPISGYVSNPACLSVCFTWSASKGWLEGADTLQPIYHAPQSERRDGEDVVISLTVYDSSGERSYDQIRLHIVNTDPR